MDKKLSISNALQPEILRAYQRDDEYKMILRYLLLESMEVFVNYRLLTKYDAEIKMGSDLLYYLLTTIRGKQTLGEEYCSIVPVKNSGPNLVGTFPSPGRRLLLSLLNAAGPYVLNKVLKRFEQPFNDYLQSKTNDLNAKMSNPSVSVSFLQILKVELLNLVPGVLFSNSVKNFGMLHLALFFLWGRYYELSKRIARVVYKYELGAEGQHQISYLNPGRVIMITIVIQLTMFAVEIVRCIRKSYQLY